MSLKENDEITNLINLDDYYSNFFFKDQKFKRSFRNKLLTLREYFASNPKIFLLAELTVGIICCGFPFIFLFYFIRSLKFQNENENELELEQEFIKAAFPLIAVLCTLIIVIAIVIVLKLRKIFKPRFQFPTWERFHLGKLIGILIKMVFLLYLVLNFLGYLNIIAANDEVFKNNINNLNPIKSIVSKIMFHNVFQKPESDIKNTTSAFALRVPNLTSTEINKILSSNDTLIIQNISLINGFLRGNKDYDRILKDFIIGTIYPAFAYSGYLVFKNIVFSAKHSFFYLTLGISMIFEYFVLCYVDKHNKFTYLIQVSPIYLSLLIYIIFIGKKIVKFNRLAKNQNNLISASLSDLCKCSINFFHVLYLISIILFTYSFIKSLDFESNYNPGKENNLVYLIDSRHTAFIAMHLFLISLTYFTGEAFFKYVFYSIEKEFFPLKKPCENCIILNQKNYNYLNYEITESEKFSD